MGGGKVPASQGRENRGVFKKGQQGRERGLQHPTCTGESEQLSGATSKKNRSRTVTFRTRNWGHGNSRAGGKSHLSKKIRPGPQAGGEEPPLCAWGPKKRALKKEWVFLNGAAVQSKNRKGVTKGRSKNAGLGFFRAIGHEGEPIGIYARQRGSQRPPGKNLEAQEVVLIEHSREN